MRRFPVRLLLLFGFLGIASIARAGDWPMWRYDAARSNSSPDPLPDQLALQWVRQFPAPRPAWPRSQQHLQFDTIIRPIVTGKLMIAGSTVNDRLTAYDTETGNEVWRFYADGPIRFAPIAHQHRIYAASDDGYLYCLDASTGKLVWKFNGGPTERRIVGNERLISSWPIRGGPVVADDTVYFAASIWPFMGVFIHAVDAESGRRIWTNSETGSQWRVHPHGAPSFGSIVPQGYLAAMGNRLIVPGGRSLPAVFDRMTGKLDHFQFGGKGAGGWNVVAHKRFYVVGGAVLALDGGAEAGRLTANVLADDLVVGDATAHVLNVAGRGDGQKRLQVSTTGPWPVTSGAIRVLAAAGGRAYAGGEGVVASINLAAGRAAGKLQQPEWSARIAGTAVSVVAGDDKLFVVTDDAKVYCFGKATKEAIEHRSDSEAVDVVADDWPEKARRILALGGATNGYAVVFGIGSGRLIEEIIAQSELHVIAVDPDPAVVARFRQRMDAAGIYGVRVAAHVGDPARFNLPPYLANLVVGENWPSGDASVRQVFQCLRPYGGTACLTVSDEQHKALSQAVSSEGLEQAAVERHGSLTVLRRNGSLAGAGQWTHQYADASNGAVSQDQLVRAPLGVLWFGGPSNDLILPRHGHGPSPQVAGGRLVIEGPDMLRCIDVYTGRLLWEKKLPGLGAYYDVTAHFPGAGEIGSNYVTLADAVYTIYGDAILEIDAASGETTYEYKLDATAAIGQQAWGFLSVSGDLLVAASGPVQVDPSGATSPNSLPPDMTPLIKRGAVWQYLAGTDAQAAWARPEYQVDDRWKTGAAGFGYGDKDDRTQLKMQRRFKRVYIRTAFDGAAAAAATRMALAINYDDAFIAYLNGTEIIRAGVGKGRGPNASQIVSHEADRFTLWDIKDFKKLLRPGSNVLALEGHNVSAGSSDFTLDPYLLIKKDQAGQAPAGADASAGTDALAAVLRATQYASASRRLVVFDRRSRKMLWSRQADLNFRHNCIVAAANKVFCIDNLSQAKRQTIMRRGPRLSVTPRLLALDGRTGKELWSTSEHVFGTFLNYSAEHDVLLQAGSAYRDRARDEVGRGMVAYQGRDGSVLWKDLERGYSGPCLLWRDKIITNGGGGYRLELLTGQETNWQYRRMYGCNTAVGSQHLLTFRSGAAGYCDLSGDSGTGNIGGFRSSCTANLIVADGVLSAPDYTRTCNCSYQNQCSLGLIHMPEAEMWTFSNRNTVPAKFGTNIGAPGDRRAEDGTLWYDLPSVGGDSPSLPVTIQGDNLSYVRHHESRVQQSRGKELPWVASTCVVGVSSIEQRVADSNSEKRRYTVRLHFAELEGRSAGQRRFDVLIQGRPVLQDFDIVGQTGASFRTVVKQFENVEADSQIRITFRAIQGQPCISGVEVIRQ